MNTAKINDLLRTAISIERERCLKAVEIDRVEFKKCLGAEDNFEKLIEKAMNALLNSIKARIEAGK